MPPTSTIPSERIAIGRAFGTCGELVQGVLPDGRRFHVTCPIDRSSEVEVRIRPADAFAVRATWGAAERTLEALRRAAELFELGAVEVVASRTTSLPAAKGLASSTADVVAAVRAVALAADQTIETATLARLATSIEPSDGIMYDGIVAADHHTGELLHRWAWSPRFVIAMFVPSASRRTADTSTAHHHRQSRDYSVLLDDLDRAMGAEDLAAVGDAATRSAHLNEPFAPNPLLPILAPAALSSGALGVCVGHSGTVGGLLFAAGPDGERDACAVIDEIMPRLPFGTVGSVERTPS